MYSAPTTNFSSPGSLKDSRGSCQNWRKYISSVKSWKIRAIALQMLWWLFLLSGHCSPTNQNNKCRKIIAFDYLCTRNTKCILDEGTGELIVVQEYLVFVLKLLLHLCRSNNLLSFLKLIFLKKKLLIVKPWKSMSKLPSMYKVKTTQEKSNIDVWWPWFDNGRKLVKQKMGQMGSFLA